MARNLFLIHDSYDKIKKKRHNKKGGFPMANFKNLFGEEQEYQCLSCDIANHKIIPPGGYIYEDDFINVSADPEIPIEGFVVLGVNKHVKSLCDFTDEERNRIMEVLNKTIQVIKREGISKEVFLIQEETSQHFHIWIVPTHEWKNNLGKDLRNLQKIIDYSKDRVTEKSLKEIVTTIEKIKKGFLEVQEK